MFALSRFTSILIVVPSWLVVVAGRKQREGLRERERGSQRRRLGWVMGVGEQHCVSVFGVRMSDRVRLLS